MSFSNFVEDILKTGPKDLKFYIESTKLFWILTVGNFSKILNALGKQKYLSNIKSSVVIVKPEGEDSISVVNFRRIPAYIQFYNPDTKQCIRIILSTLAAQTIIICFYSNYQKNGKNNHLGKDTTMVNEIFGPTHLTQDDSFVEKMVLFLLGSKDTPYATNVLNKND